MTAQTVQRQPKVKRIIEHLEFDDVALTGLGLAVLWAVGILVLGGHDFAGPAVLAGGITVMYALYWACHWLFEPRRTTNTG